ncbi:MAG: hypothetical protein KJZ92_14990 [Rhodocyclaceae bacterium]|nr:hypothetical protein [Rhodocyclaceae bacterium]MCL4682562.1 hypothetical protein [Rhodocyclaceae bacterium]
MKLKCILAALCATALSLPALAQTTSTPRIDQRQANQQQRIDQGVQSGALTQQEAARLQHGQEHVQNLENKATADGKVTAKERARIEHAQDVQSKRVYRQKHDRQHDLNHDGRMDRPARRK